MDRLIKTILLEALGLIILFVITLCSFIFLEISNVDAYVKKEGEGRNYKAKVVDVYDCDTFTLEIDLGLGIQITEKARLYGIDCPELRTSDVEEKKRGCLAKEYTAQLMFGKVVDIVAYERDKYGRILVEVLLNGKYLTEMLIEEGLGVAYYGEKKKAWEFGGD